MKLASSGTKYKQESTKTSLKLCVLKSNFMPTYLIYKYIFFFHFELKSDPDPIFSHPDSDARKKVSDPHPCVYPKPGFTVGSGSKL